MSWEIIYDKQFVKVDNKYISLILTGSNNCYESSMGGRERRERNWYNISHINNKGKTLATAKELLDGCDTYRKELIERHKERDDEYSDKRFGYFSSLCIGSTTHQTTFGQYKGIFATGVKKALTVEQLNEFGIHLMVHTYTYREDETKQECETLGIKFLETEYPKTTQELAKAIRKFEKNYKGSKIGWHVTYENSWFAERKVKEIRRKLFPKQRHEAKYVETKKYYTIIADNGGYFYKFTKWGYRYSYVSDNYRFLTKKEAEQFIKRKRNRGNLTVKLIKTDYPVKVKIK